MNLLPQSNIYLVLIPKNYTNDIHICGRCKVQYTSLSLFLKHKETCKENDSKDVDQDQFAKKMEVDNLIEIGSIESFNETIEKDPAQIHLLNNLLTKDQSQLRPCKIESFQGQELCIKETCLGGNNNAMQTKGQLVVDCKRTLQNDEEDIATLLANQLKSETSADELNADVEVREPEPVGQGSKEKKDKDENKVMYRGKMRKLFNCQVEGCVYKTLLRKDIERHSRVHTGERPFKCFLCGKAFNRTDKLLLHQRIHAGDKRYKCTKCDYASVDSGSLIKHLRVHNGERPFKCQLCSYRARDSSQLTVHLRTHTGDSPFICTNANCKAAFNTNSDLKRHMVVHSEKKPHSCTYCPYKSTLKRNLQIHVQSQHPNGELEYKCPLCSSYVLPTSRKLKNHIKKHHGPPEERGGAEKGLADPAAEERSPADKPETGKKRSGDKIAVGIMNKAYDCKLCDASFVCQDSLVTHHRFHSKIEDELRRRNPDFPAKSRKAEEEAEKKAEGPGGDAGPSETCDSFGDSLRNAEILASLNPGQGIGQGMRQYVMIAPEALQNVYNSEEYVLVQN